MISLLAEKPSVARAIAAITGSWEKIRFLKSKKSLCKALHNDFYAKKK